MIIIIGIDSFPFRIDEYREKELVQCASFSAARTVISELLANPEIKIDFIRIGKPEGELYITNPFDFIDWLADLQKNNNYRFRIRNAWTDHTIRHDLNDYILKKGLTLIF